MARAGAVLAGEMATMLLSSIWDSMLASCAEPAGPTTMSMPRVCNARTFSSARAGSVPVSTDILPSRHSAPPSSRYALKSATASLTAWLSWAPSGASSPVRGSSAAIRTSPGTWAWDSPAHAAPDTIITIRRALAGRIPTGVAGRADKTIVAHSA